MRKHRRGYRQGLTPSDPSRFHLVYLYVIECDRFVKVGISANPEKRVKGMATDNPFELRLRFRRRVYSFLAGEAEFNAHQQLAQYHHANEWFTCPSALAHEAIHVHARDAMRKGMAIWRAEQAELQRKIDAMADSDTQAFSDAQ